MLGDSRLKRQLEDMNIRLNHLVDQVDCLTQKMASVEGLPDAFGALHRTVLALNDIKAQDENQDDLMKDSDGMYNYHAYVKKSRTRRGMEE